MERGIMDYQRFVSLDDIHTLMEETQLEYILTHSYKADLISYMRAHPEDFEEVVKLALADNPPYSWRASWLLWSCMDYNDVRIHKHLEQIIDILPHRRDDQVRELLIILQRMELSDDHEGKLFDRCISIWEKRAKQPSVRFNAFKMMIRIIKKHPDLSKELNLLLEEQYLENLSECAKKSIGRMVTGISPLPT